MSLFCYSDNRGDNVGFELINILKKQKGWTNEDLAKASGVPKATIDKLTAGVTNNPNFDTVAAIADALGCTVDQFKTKRSSSRPESDQRLNIKELHHIKKYRSLDRYGKELIDIVIDKEYERCTDLPEEDEEEEQNTIFLPAFWNKASAGEGYDLDTDDCDELQVILNESTRKADMIISIQGDSMEPRYHDGDRVLVRKQPEIELGQVGIFRVGTMGYIKERGPDRLISINPNYEDVYIGEEEECVCIGKVMGVLEDEWIVG